jgi:hypothetical protein
MSSTVLYMSMSLDGFVAGPNRRPPGAIYANGATRRSVQCWYEQIVIKEWAMQPFRKSLEVEAIGHEWLARTRGYR